MGRAEKANKNSAWFQKHHPELHATISVVAKPHLNILAGFIKKVGEVLSIKGNKSPKEN